MDQSFLEDVKSLEEFFERFNGTKMHPQTIELEDSIKRKANLALLFDYDYYSKPENQTIFKQFVDSVEVSGVLLADTDSLLIAECIGNVTIDNKEREITLFLKKDIDMHGYERWGFCGAKGVIDIIPDIDTNSLSNINPVDNNVNFMGVADIVNNNLDGVFSLRSQNTELDELTLFFTLLWLEKIKFNYISGIRYHCAEIPGWIINIKYFPREAFNGGWLIESLEECDSTKRLNYIKNIIGGKE